MNNSVKRKAFLSIMIRNSLLNGMPAPESILKLGEEIGITESESSQIASFLVSKGYARFRSIGDVDIELTPLYFSKL